MSPWPPSRLVGVREVVPRGKGVWVVLAEHPHKVGEVLLQERDCLTQPPRRPIGVREVVPRPEGVGVVLAEHLNDRFR